MVKQSAYALLKSSEGGPVVVTRNWKPVAVLIGIQDEDEIERLLMAYSPRLRAILERSRRQIRGGRGIVHEQFWKEIETTASTKPSTRRSRTPRN